MRQREVPLIDGVRVIVDSLVGPAAGHETFGTYGVWDDGGDSVWLPNGMGGIRECGMPPGSGPAGYTLVRFDEYANRLIRVNGNALRWDVVPDLADLGAVESWLG